MGECDGDPWFWKPPQRISACEPGTQSQSLGFRRKGLGFRASSFVSRSTRNVDSGMFKNIPSSATAHGIPKGGSVEAPTVPNSVGLTPKPPKP